MVRTLAEGVIASAVTVEDGKLFVGSFDQGIAEIALIMRTFKIVDVRARLQQVWKGLRISFAVFTVLAVLNIVDAYVYWGLHAHRVPQGESALASAPECRGGYTILHPIPLFPLFPLTPSSPNSL